MGMVGQDKRGYVKLESKRNPETGRVIWVKFSSPIRMQIIPLTTKPEITHFREGSQLYS